MATKKTLPKKTPKKASKKTLKKASSKKTSKKNTGKTSVKKVSSPSAPPPPITASGQKNSALFTLKIYRGEGMALLAMNWANGKPPLNFVGFAIEYQEPGGTQFFALKNRLSFLENDGNVNPNTLSTRLSPIQKFRWIHFPYNSNLPGNYVYRVTPVFWGTGGQLSYGDFQEASVQLQSETYPGLLNVTFTRGFIASQSFVDNFGTNGGVGTLLPTTANQGLTFKSTDPKEPAALNWMGFEDRLAILSVLDQAISDPTAQVRVTAYDFNEPEIVSRLVKLGKRLRVIIDDSGTHGQTGSAENTAQTMLTASAGAANVQRQHMGQLQHNKTIAIQGNKIQVAVCGSTNLSWRGFFVQNNNAIILQGPSPVKIFFDAFDNLWNNKNNPAGFGSTASAGWNNLNLSGIQAKISFSPHNSSNAILAGIATDIGNTRSSLFYSLAFLYETPGPILNAIEKVTANTQLFVYGISDKKVGGLDVQSPNGNPPIVFPAALLANVPQPFKQEATGGSGTRMHHKFVVIDFDKPTARVYMGSYNFSSTADLKNGENLLLIQDQRVAVSYMIQAVAMFDHYEFRDAAALAASSSKKLYLQKPPQSSLDKPWWDKDYTIPQKIRDREIFS
jgi:phosphatidylserine/phosphatidylglycerophosphate/cardiolipin synthase-like enzyme